MLVEKLFNHFILLINISRPKTGRKKIIVDEYYLRVNRFKKIILMDLKYGQINSLLYLWICLLQ